jgi:hypothetical protein
MSDALKSLAEYAASTWLRDTCPAPSADLPDEVRALALHERVAHRETARQIREAVQRREFALALDLMNPVGVPHFRFLERAMPLMASYERETFLRDVWCRSRLRLPGRRLLRLLQAVPELAETVPSDWPETVQLFRGSTAPTFSSARSKAKQGLSWTTDRSIALRFASADHSLRSIGCLATADVLRTSILAYFHDPDSVEIDGRALKFHGYHEHECIVDPSTITHVTFERLEPLKSHAP